MEYDIEELKKIVSPIAKKYGVERVYLFGSRARGDNTPESDFDFSFDPGTLVKFKDYINFIDELESALKHKVDVVYRDDVKCKGFYNRWFLQRYCCMDDRVRNNLEVIMHHCDVFDSLTKRFGDVFDDLCQDDAHNFG